MTVQNADREAIRHGKITEKPLRERPSYPTWAIKLTMAITGLIFGLFVLGHMVGNLKIFMPLNADGSAPIDDYGEFLRTIGEPLFPREGFLWIVRIVLLACLVLHVWGAFALRARSSKSRGRFQRTNLMGGWQSTATRAMLVTGVILLLFIIFHLIHFTIVKPNLYGSASSEAIKESPYVMISAAFAMFVCGCLSDFVVR